MAYRYKFATVVTRQAVAGAIVALSGEPTATGAIDHAKLLGLLESTLDLIAVADDPETRRRAHTVCASFINVCASFINGEMSNPR
jgi:hypothetical protein